MSDYYEYDSDSFTTIDENFIGGTSLVIIGAVALVIVILLLLAIRIFSKKLDDLGYDGAYQNYEEPIEEIEPLPLYVERETRPEMNLSDYNTINTIPKDTMNIINRLNSLSEPTIMTTSNNNVNINHNSNPNDPTSTNNINIDFNLSTSTLPLPTPEKENMPCIPPPCYDIAITQPRINNEGMIVLPQDPTFNQPIFTRSSSTTHHHRHSLRRNRHRFMRFFSHSPTTTSSFNNYRIPTRSPSMISTSSDSSNTNQNQYQNIPSNPNSNNSSETSNRRGSTTGAADDSESSSRFIFGRHGHHYHRVSSSSRRYRRRLLRHHRHSTDNASISSISICPTTPIEVPEGHYNINRNTHFEVRSPSQHYQNNPTTTAGATTTTVTDPETSMSMQPLLSTPSSSSSGSSHVDDTISPQNSSSGDRWMDLTPYQPSSSNQEFIHIDSGININDDLKLIQPHSNNNQRTNTSNEDESNPTTPFNSSVCVNISMNADPVHNDYHQITISNDYLNINNEHNNQNNNNNNSDNNNVYSSDITTHGDEDFHNSVINLVMY